MLALAAVLLWSTVAAAFKLTLRYTDAVSLVWWSSLVSFVVLGLLVHHGSKWGILREYLSKHWPKAVMLGSINPFLYYLTLFKAYELLPAQEAQAINYTWALMLAFLSVPFLGHKLSRSDIVAAFMGYAGVLIVATHGSLSDLRLVLSQGVIMALVSTIFWALYWIFNTKIDIDTTVMMFAGFGFGLIFLGLYILFVGADVHLPDGRVFAGSAYIGLFEMSVTYVLWGTALKYASRTALVSNLIFLSPVLSLVLIHFLVGEKIYYSTLAALALILSGLFLQHRK